MSKHLPPKFGTMPVISSLKSGRDQTISSAVISMPSSTIRRTVFVCAKVARGRAAIAQNTCLAAQKKSAQIDENKLKTQKQTSQIESPT